MCRCCQSCWEDFYWTCIEERFCYDESIANYNPDEDEYFEKQNGTVNGVQSSDNNNMPICNQPINRNPSVLSSKIHEDDYRREIQTTVPILAPEILAVFANSQIFNEHQPKLTRNATKNYLPGIHGKDKETDEEKLIKRLEGDTEITSTHQAETADKKPISFTISPDSPPSELRRSLSNQKFHAIIEEDASSVSDKDEVILRPQKISADPNGSNNHLKAPDLFSKNNLRNVKSVPYFPIRPASENDIFIISETSSRISMTPEIPSISYSTLPKNYEDTPTIEKYRESTSLYSIQTANMAKAMKVDDYSMPRYFRKSTLLSQSTDSFASRDDVQQQPQKRYERSKRLKNLRDSLPPLRIHSIRHKFRDEAKNVD